MSEEKTALIYYDSSDKAVYSFNVLNLWADDEYIDIKTYSFIDFDDDIVYNHSVNNWLFLLFMERGKE